MLVTAQFLVYKARGLIDSASNHIQLAHQLVICKIPKIKMKFLIAFAAIVAVAIAAPPANPEAIATIVNQQADIDPQGNYQSA